VVWVRPMSLVPPAAVGVGSLISYLVENRRRPAG
jgi:hypothetical protein